LKENQKLEMIQNLAGKHVDKLEGFVWPQNLQMSLTVAKINRKVINVHVIL